MKKILVTGCAGFIGSNLTDKLLELDNQVVGIDNFNNYYEPKIKNNNIHSALKNKKFKLFREDILNFEKVKSIFEKERPEYVVNLAARAGVRPSIDDPELYTEVNVLGTVNLLKFSIDFGIKKFIFGSSSSVYGNSKRLPFTENDLCDEIISPYGASKRAAEFFVESFYHSYGLKCVILRFFTVYGPRGRPDMAPAIFTKAIAGGNPIKIFGDGTSSRDYTYISDIVDGIVKSISTDTNFEIINLGNSHPVSLGSLVGIIEKTVSKKAKIINLPIPPGDVEKTWSNTKKAEEALEWFARTGIKDGLSIYADWTLKTKKGI